MSKKARTRPPSRPLSRRRARCWCWGSPRARSPSSSGPSCSRCAPAAPPCAASPSTSTARPSGTPPSPAACTRLLGIPVAGLGLLWGLVATALAGLYLAWQRGGYTVRPAVNGLRLTAAAGVLTGVVFAARERLGRGAVPHVPGHLRAGARLRGGGVARAARSAGASGGRVGPRAEVDGRLCRGRLRRAAAFRAAPPRRLTAAE